MSFESRNQTSTDLLKPYLDQQLGLLDERRRPWTGVWNEISIHIDPDTGRFLKGVQGQNSREDNWGGPNRSGIVNNLTGHAMSTMASGIMSHLTNPGHKMVQSVIPRTEGGCVRGGEGVALEDGAGHEADVLMVQPLRSS